MGVLIIVLCLAWLLTAVSVAWLVHRVQPTQVTIRFRITTLVDVELAIRRDVWRARAGSDQ